MIDGYHVFDRVHYSKLQEVIHIQGDHKVNRTKPGRLQRITFFGVTKQYSGLPAQACWTRRRLSPHNLSYASDRPKGGTDA
jgi:hypothetical protein